MDTIIPLLVTATILILLFKATIGHFVGKGQNGIHGDIARHIVKKTVGNQKKPKTGDTTEAWLLRKLRKLIFGP